MRAAAASLILGLLAALQAGGGTFAADAREIKIGLLLSGDPAESRMLKRGAELGVASAERLIESRIVLVTRGQHGQWGVEGNEAAALALDEAVDGMITPPSGTAAHQVLQVAGRTHLPVISLCSDSSVTSAGIPWTGRIAPRTEDEAAVIFKHAGISQWAAVIPPERDGREIRADLERAAAAGGIKIERWIVRGQRVEELKRAAAEVGAGGVLLWLDAESASLFAGLLREAGFKGMIAARGANAPKGADRRKRSPSVITAALPISEQFRNAYAEKCGSEPEQLAALAHDAVVCLAKLIATGHKRVDSKFAPIQGATGEIRFDDQGNRVVLLESISMDGGRSVLAAPHKPSPP